MCAFPDTVALDLLARVFVLNFDLIIVLALLAAAVALFAVGKPRMDAVALLALVALPFTGVVSVSEVLAGFGDPTVVLIAALFVVGEGLVRTGVAQRVGDWLVSKSGRSETVLLVLLMLVVAGIGSVMSSTAAVAIFIPVVLRICRNAGIAPGRLMMPLSFAALFSGMMTLIGTPPNLVVHGELLRRGLEGLHFFSVTPIGLPLLVLGIAYMLLVRPWLAKSAPSNEAPRHRPNWSEWIDKYRLAGREHRLRVTPQSPLVGKTLEALDLRGSAGANIVAIERAGRFTSELIRPEASTTLHTDDVLLLDLAPSVEIDDLCSRLRLAKLPLTGGYFVDQSQEIGMAEVMIPVESNLIGQSVIEARIRTLYGLTVVGMRRGREALSESMLQERLQPGDTLLLVGRWKQIRRLQAGIADMIVLDLPAEVDDVVPAPRRAPHAVFALGVVITLMVTGAVSNVQAALIGCVLMGTLRCIDIESAYRAIHWQSIIVIVGMLPFSLALQKTGGVDWAVNALVGMAGEAGPRTVLAALFVATAIMGLFISNTATAVLMAPVALTVASVMNVSPYPFALTVAIAASCAFMTPVSSPVNTLVVGPGNYRFGDFVKVGVPFAVLALLVSVALIPLVFPF